MRCRQVFFKFSILKVGLNQPYWLTGVDKAFCFILCVGSVASEEARKWSGAKKKIGERSKPSVAWRRTKGEGAISFFLSWSDCSDHWLLTSERCIPAMYQFYMQISFGGTQSLFLNKAIVYVGGILIVDGCI